MYRVLLADDELIFLEFLQYVITWSDFECEICACKENGKSVYEYIIENKPDIVFIDINMPQMDGLEVCKLLKDHNINSRFVIMTGHDKFSFAYQAIKLGIDDYLLKPFSEEELIVALTKVISLIKKEKKLKVQNESYLKKEIENKKESATKYEIMSQKIEDYLLINYTNNYLSLEMIARDLGFESSYLRRIYKWNTGFTIMQKLESIRINKAKQLLCSGQYQNQEIASLAGFSDQYYFSKRFKQICGMAPTEYRDSVTGSKRCFYQ